MPARHPLLVRVLRILQSYGVDWLIAVTLILFSQFFLQKFQNISDFDLTDTSIQASFKAKQVFPDSTLVFILIFCYVLLITSNLILSRNMWDLHHALLGLTVAFSLVGITVQIVRILWGRPRPDFIARCNPFPNATNGHFFGLANVTTVCQTPVTDPLIVDGMRSFFSGHACLSSAGLGYNSLYWAGKLQLFNRRAYTSKGWLVFTPLLGSIVICLTRLTDHRHHLRDVTVGFFFGLLPAYIFYRQFFPSLEDPHSYIAYPPRFAGENGRWSWTARGWIPSSSAAPIDDGPMPLLPTNRMSREMPVGASTSYLGHRSVEADLEAGGLITTPFDASDTSYSGMPKPLDPNSSGY